MSANDDNDPLLYEFDPRPADELFTDVGPGLAKLRTAVIRTSDRIGFKRCRRRWHWQSHLRGNLQPTRAAAPLWFGSGVHFALEDFHSANSYGHPWAAFKAYVKATKAYNPHGIPADWKEQTALGRDMLSYYADHWLPGRDPLTTFVYEGVPQVEVNFRIPIPFDASKYGYDNVVYSGTLDRVAIDENGNLWVVEYKTAKVIQTSHFGLDPQVTAYVWAGSQLYPGYNMVGVIYMQFRKTLPKPPEVLATGRISTNKQMSTTYSMYREALVRLYGREFSSIAPSENISYLNRLAREEDYDKGDKFIRRDKVYRNQQMCESEGVKILMEVEDMLNPDLPLYPNPDRSCLHMCPWNSVCVSLDDGSGWEEELASMFEQRPAGYDSWRKFLPAPTPQLPF